MAAYCAATFVNEKIASSVGLALSSSCSMETRLPRWPQNPRLPTPFRVYRVTWRDLHSSSPSTLLFVPIFIHHVPGRMHPDHTPDGGPIPIESLVLVQATYIRCSFRLARIIEACRSIHWTKPCHRACLSSKYAVSRYTCIVC